MKRILRFGRLVLGASALLMAQTNNVSVYTLKDFAGVLPPTSAATANTLFLQFPDDVLADGKGNVYVTDTGGHRVWKIDKTGTPSIVIGTGVFGTPSFGKGASGQPLSGPSGLALDAARNLYISDRNNNRIYKIDTTGVVTLVAGVAGNGRLGGDGRAANQADINGPRQLAINPVDGNLYFADTGNQRIREINLTTGVINTVVGSSASGNAQSGGFSGDRGSPVLAKLSSPEGVAFDSFGNMFIADTGNNRIRMVVPGSCGWVCGSITTLAGRALTEQEAATGVSAPYTANVQATTLACNKPTPGALSSQCITIGDGADLSRSLLASPSRIVLDANNNIIFTDRANNRIREIRAKPLVSGLNRSQGYATIATIIGTGTGSSTGDGGLPKSATVNNPYGISLDPTTNRLFFTERLANRVRLVDRSIGTIQAFAGAPTFNGDQTALTTMLNDPRGVAVDNAGNVYITDTGNNIIRKIDTAGNVTTIAGRATGGGDAASEGIDPLAAAVNQPGGIAVDPIGNVIVYADIGSNRIRRIVAGSITTVAGCVFTRLTTASRLAQNCTFTADGLPATTLKLNLSSGTTQNTHRLAGVALDANGAVYFTEPGNHVVRKVQSDGTVVTIAGQYGVAGSGGDGGPALDLFLSSPEGIAVDNQGIIVVADSTNFAAHLIAGGVAYPLAGQVGSNSNDNETTNNQSSVPVPAYTKRYRVIQGVAVDNGGNAFLTDTTNNKVDRIPYAAPAACFASAGTTCAADKLAYVDYRVAGNEGNTNPEYVFDYTAGTGIASTAQLSFPMGVAVGADGKVYFADNANNLIRVAIPPAPSK